MADYYGISASQDYLTLQQCADIMQSKDTNPYLIGELKMGGLGEDLCKEALEYNG